MMLCSLLIQRDIESTMTLAPYKLKDVKAEYNLCLFVCFYLFIYLFVCLFVLKWIFNVFFLYYLFLILCILCLTF